MSKKFDQEFMRKIETAIYKHGTESMLASEIKERIDLEYTVVLMRRAIAVAFIWLAILSLIVFNNL